MSKEIDQSSWRGAVHVTVALLLSVCVNGLLFAALAYVNQRFAGRGQQVASQPRQVYVPPPHVEPPPEQEPLEPEDMPEPEPMPMEPMELSLEPLAVAPRLDLNLDLDAAPDPMAAKLTVGEVTDANAKTSGISGPMQLTDVDRRPQRTRGQLPSYPHWARIRGLEAELTVEFIVSAEGIVEDVRIRDLDGDERFSRMVLDAVRRWRFDPALYQGQTVPVRCSKKLTYRLRD
ncbi:MAG: energy transducer TonB [Planctomycetota bacterium]